MKKVNFVKLFKMYQFDPNHEKNVEFVRHLETVYFVPIIWKAISIIPLKGIVSSRP